MSGQVINTNEGSAGQVTSRELDLIIKELERLAACYERLVENTDVKFSQKVDKSSEKWKYSMIFGSYGFTLFVLGLFLKVHFGV